MIHMSNVFLGLTMSHSHLSDETLDREIRNARSQRNFARLSVQLIEVALQRSEGIIQETLDQFQEPVREPEPNPNRFIGYVKYDKDAYIQAYERLKPTRDLVRLLNTFLPNMRNMRDTHEERYGSLLREREMRQLQKQVQAHMKLNQNPPAPDDENDDNPPANNDLGFCDQCRCHEN